MVFQESGGASWSLLLTLVMVSVSTPWISALQPDQLTDLSLQPAQGIIDASWRLVNPTDEVASFRVKWWDLDLYGVDHNCTVNYRESESQQYSTVDCDEVPMLFPDTVYSVTVQGLNNRSVGITQWIRMDGRTLPVLTDQLTDVSLQPAQGMIAVSWRLVNSSGEVASFRVKWWSYGMDENDHNCTVNYRESESQQYSTNQCDETPTLLPDTGYSVIMQGLNKLGIGITKRIRMNERTLTLDQLTDLSLQPTQNMIAASWRLLYITEQITSFQVKWITLMRLTPVLHTCTVKYQASGSQRYNTDQCDRTPSLQPNTAYSVLVEGLNYQSDVVSQSELKMEQTLSEGELVSPSTYTDQLTELSLHPRHHMIAASWRLVSFSGKVTSLQVKWKSPSGLDEEYPMCIVQYRESAEQQYSTDQCDETPPLNHCTEYVVKVLGVNVQSETIIESAWMPGNTLSQAPDSVTSLTSTAVGARFIALSWQRPDTRCNITGYHITYYGTAMQGGKHMHNGSVSQENDLDNTTFYYNLTSLEPYSSYNVCVVAENQQGSSSMNCLMEIQTKETTAVHSNKSVILIVGGILATVLLIAAIAVGVILWRRRQTKFGARKRSSSASAAAAPTTTAQRPPAEAASSNCGEKEAEEETQQLMTASLPLRPMSSLPVEEEEFSNAHESIAGHDYC